MTTIKGTSGNDRLQGTVADDTIFGLAGRDTIYGGKGSDDLYGGRGDDRLFGGLDQDSATWRIGEGNDYFGGGGDFDVFFFDMSPSNGRVTLTALGGGKIQSYAVTDTDGTETIALRNVEDVNITTGDTDDFIDLRGVDMRSGGGAHNILTGGGDDIVYGSSYQDTVVDQKGDDIYRLGGGKDFYQNTFGGNNQVFLGGGRDTVFFTVSEDKDPQNLTILDFNDEEDRLEFGFVGSEIRELDTNRDGFFGQGDLGVTIENGSLVFDADTLYTYSSAENSGMIVLSGVVKVDADAVDATDPGGGM